MNLGVPGGRRWGGDGEGSLGVAPASEIAGGQPRGGPSGSPVDVWGCRGSRLRLPKMNSWPKP